jgi:hypothetical protein
MLPESCWVGQGIQYYRALPERMLPERRGVGQGVQYYRVLPGSREDAA